MMLSFQKTAGFAAVVPDGTVGCKLTGFVELAGKKLEVVLVGKKPDVVLVGTKLEMRLAGKTRQIDLLGKSLVVELAGSYVVVAGRSVGELEAAARKMAEKFVV